MEPAFKHSNVQEGNALGLLHSYGQDGAPLGLPLDVSEVLVDSPEDHDDQADQDVSAEHDLPGGSILPPPRARARPTQELALSEVEDGYKWRKYGQKHIKGHPFARSYFKCTSRNCPVKKQVEHSEEGGMLVESRSYKGDHNHPPPQISRHSVPDQTTFRNTVSEFLSPKFEEPNLSARVLLDSSQDFSDVHRMGNLMSVHESLGTEPMHLTTDLGLDGQPLSRLVVETHTDVDHLDDGYTWRKYGQKTVRGFQRSYYECAAKDCHVKKHVEHHDASVINTYEGTHSHPPPELENGAGALKKRRTLERLDRKRVEDEEASAAAKIENYHVKLWESGQLPPHARHPCQWENCTKRLFTLEGFLSHCKLDHIKPQANKRGRRQNPAERPRKGFFCGWESCSTQNEPKHGQRELLEHLSAKHLRFLKQDEPVKRHIKTKDLSGFSPDMVGNEQLDLHILPEGLLPVLQVPDEHHHDHDHEILDHTSRHNSHHLHASQLPQLAPPRPDYEADHDFEQF